MGAPAQEAVDGLVGEGGGGGDILVGQVDQYIGGTSGGDGAIGLLGSSDILSPIGSSDILSPRRRKRKC